MAIDLDTIKGETSTEFGKSLLGAMSTENERIRKQNEKAQKKSERIALGLDIGMGFANYVINEDNKKFEQQEMNAGNIIKTRTAYRNSEEIAGQETTAKAYDGGYDAYWTAQGEARAKLELDAKYGTYYNKTQYDALLKSRGKQFGDILREAHTKRLNAYNKYISTVGPEANEDAYLEAIRDSRPQDVQSKINKVLGKVTGLSADDEINTNISSILSSSENINKYQKIYEETKNATLSVILAEELPEKLGVPSAVVVGEVLQQKTKDPFGKETTEYLQVMRSSNPDGSSTTTLVNLDSGDVNSKGSLSAKNNFNVNVAAATDNSTFTTLGSDALNAYVPENTKEIINNLIDEEVKSLNYKYGNKKERGAAREAIIKRQHARVGVMIYNLMDQLDLSSKRAAQVATQVYIDDATANGTGTGSKGAGIYSPYVTLKAMALSETSGEGKFTSTEIRKLVGNTGENLIIEYVNSSKTERKNLIQIFKKLEGLNGFEYIQEAQMVAEEVAKYPTQNNSEIISTAKAVRNDFRNSKNNSLSAMQATAAAITNAPDPASSAIVVPPPAPKTRGGRKTESAEVQKQRKNYKDIIKAEKQVQYIESLLVNPKVKANIPRYQRSLDEAKKTLNQLKAEYTSTYGE